MTACNENRPGYKKTKVGWIPEEWDCCTFGSLFSIQLGKMLNEKARLGPNQKPYLANYNVRWGAFDLVDVQTMHFNPREEAKFELRAGDLLVCEGGEVARSAIWKEQIVPCFYQKAIHRLRPKANAVNIYFSHCFLMWAVNSPLMVHFTGQTSIAHFTREQFIRFPIPLPPLAEQERIAEVLGAWDRAIGLTDRLIEVKQRLKKGLMQQLLTGRLRFPQFGKPARKHGELPKGWKLLSLNKFGKIVSGGTPDTAESSYWDGPFPWVTPSEITRLDSRFLSSTARTLSEDGLRASAATLIPAYSIVVCTRATVGECAITLVPMTTNQGFKSIILKENFDCDFIYYALCSSKREFKRMAAGSTFFEVPKRDFERIATPIPLLPEQRRIASCLSACDREIQSLTRKRNCLQQQKRGLMQKLLTGEVRVHVQAK